MPYYLIDRCPTVHPELCCIRKPPEGLELLKWKLSKGETIGTDYPDDAAVHMAKDRGMGLGGLVSNTNNLLILHCRIVELLLSEHQHPSLIDIHPLIIHNQKGRIASRDYRIVNPLGSLDCLDQQNSEIERTTAGTVTSVPKPVLSRRLLEPSRAIFRIATYPNLVVANERWLLKLKALGLETSNIYGTELDEAD